MTWKHFLQWIETAEDAAKVAIPDAKGNTEDFADNISESQMLSLLHSDSTHILLSHFKKFLVSTKLKWETLCILDVIHRHGQYHIQFDKRLPRRQLETTFNSNTIFRGMVFLLQ